MSFPLSLLDNTTYSHTQQQNNTYPDIRNHLSQISITIWQFSEQKLKFNFIQVILCNGFSAMEERKVFQFNVYLFTFHTTKVSLLIILTYIVNSILHYGVVLYLMMMTMPNRFVCMHFTYIVNPTRPLAIKHWHKLKWIKSPS